MRPLLILALAWLAGIVAAPAGAQLPDATQAIQSVRPSVLAVGTFQRTRSPAFKFLGTAFVVGDGTLVATNAHVLPQTLNEQEREVLAVLLPEPGQGERLREAVRVAVDPDHDLALLRLSGAPLPALKLADGGSRREGEFLL